MTADAPGSEASPPCWRPSSCLSNRLLLGTLGALGSMVLVLVTMILFCFWQFPGEPFHLCWWLSTASSLLLLAPLAAYHRLGTEVESKGLRKTSGCLALAAIVGPLLEAADPQLVPRVWASILLACGGLGVVVMFLLAIFYPQPRKPPESESELPAARSETEQSGHARGAEAGVGGGILFLVFLGLKYVGHALLGQGKAWDLETWTFGVWGVLIVLLLVLVVWFGAVKFGVRDKLGAIAGALGLYEMLCAVAATVALVVLIVTLADAEQPGMNEQQAEQAVNAIVESWTWGGMIVQASAMTCWAILTALLFSVLRSRYEPESTLEPLAR